MYQYLRLHRPEPAITCVWLARPEAANALNTALAVEIKQVFDELGKNPDCRAMLLGGEGRHFCAGADLKERKNMDETAWEAQHGAFRAARDAILACPKPVIAAVQGAAYAGGLELALACDFIYAADNARLALTEATLGIMPGMGGTQTLPRAVGMRRAKEILLTGQPFSAQEALGWGMVNRVIPADSLRQETEQTAKIIAANAPLSIKAIKNSVNTGAPLSLEQSLALELSNYRLLLRSKDRHEGINAFNEKRKPIFCGE